MKSSSKINKRAFTLAFESNDEKWRQSCMRTMNAIYWLEKAITSKENYRSTGPETIADLERHDAFSEDIAKAINNLQRALVALSMDTKRVVPQCGDLIPYISRSDKELILLTARDLAQFLADEFSTIAQDLTDFVERIEALENSSK